MVLLIFILLLLGLFQARPAPEPPTIILTLQQRLADNLRQGRLMQALYQTEALAAQTGWNANLLRTAGEIWYSIGDYVRAAGYWAAMPDDIPTLRQLARIYLSLQDWPAAATTLSRLLARAPDDRWAQYQLGLLTIETDPTAARNYLQQATNDPIYGVTAQAIIPLLENSAPHRFMQIGIILAEHEQWNSAEYAFEKALATDGPEAEALAYDALARERQDKDGSANMNRAVELAPQNAQVRYLQGLLARANGDLLGSLEALQLAVSLNPINPAYTAELGTAYQLQGDTEQAEYWLQRAVTLSNHDPRFEALLQAFLNSLPAN